MVALALQSLPWVDRGQPHTTGPLAKNSLVAP